MSLTLGDLDNYPLKDLDTLTLKELDEITPEDLVRKIQNAINEISGTLIMDEDIPQQYR